MLGYAKVREEAPEAILTRSLRPKLVVFEKSVHKHDFCIPIFYPRKADAAQILMGYACSCEACKESIAIDYG